MVRHPKYKTQLCKTYHSSGFCPYGPRCNFIHENFIHSNFIHGSNNNGNLLTMDGTFSSTGSSSSSNSSGINAVASAVAILNSTLLNGQTTSISNNSAKSSIDSIEINTASSGISSMSSSNTNSVGSAGSNSPSTSPQQFPSSILNQSQQIKKANSKLQDLILPISPLSSIGQISPAGTSSGNSSPLQQQLSSLSSKSDDVFYKYL